MTSIVTYNGPQKLLLYFNAIFNTSKMTLNFATIVHNYVYFRLVINIKKNKLNYNYIKLSIIMFNTCKYR